MKRKEVIKHLERVLATAGRTAASISLIHKTTGERIDVDGDLALCLVSSALLYAVEVLSDDMQPALSDKEALEEIVTSACHTYACDL